MSIRRVPFVFSLALAWSWSGVGIAHAGNPLASTDRPARFFVGADLGYSLVHIEDRSDPIKVVAWPGYVGTYVPSLRVGLLAGASGEHALFLRSGYVKLSIGTESAHNLGLTANYLYTLPLPGAAAPFFSFGVGIMEYGDGARGDTSPTVGGGGGLRLRVDEDHGAIRLETRVDYVGEGDSGTYAKTVCSFLLGFELWAR